MKRGAVRDSRPPSLTPAVELREVQVFLTVAEELHFGRAGERLALTPSRVSQIVRTLEARVGGKLFDRTSRRVRLTPAGEELQRRMKPAYEQVELAFAQTRELARGMSGTLRLGTYAYAAGEPHLLKIIRTFETRHPGCQVRVTETGIARNPLDWLRRNEIDILVLRPVSDPDTQVGPILAREPRLLAVARHHPLAQKDSVSVEDLAQYTSTDVPALPREIMESFSPPRTPSGRPIPRAALNSIAEAAVRVATGELVHPTVSLFFERYPEPDVIAIPIRDLPPAETALLWRKNDRSLKIQAFVSTVAEVIPPSDPRRAPTAPRIPDRSSAA
jgi:DNA-binding transcriptional LysR family regulator